MTVRGNESLISYYLVNDPRITKIVELQNGISQSETLPHYAEYPPFLFTLKSSGFTHKNTAQSTADINLVR